MSNEEEAVLEVLDDYVEGTFNKTKNSNPYNTIRKYNLEFKQERKFNTIRNTIYKIYIAIHNMIIYIYESIREISGKSLENTIITLIGIILVTLYLYRQIVGIFAFII